MWLGPILCSLPQWEILSPRITQVSDYLRTDCVLTEEGGALVAPSKVWVQRVIGRLLLGTNRGRELPLPR